MPSDPGPATDPDGITYLVALHNQERFVSDCLRSLLAQTDPRWRCVVFDDASTDGSLEVVRRFEDPRIRVVEGRPNVGLIGALRRLFEEAETDRVAILDPDDALHPEATAEVRRAFDRDPVVGFVYSKRAIYDGSWNRFVQHSKPPSRPTGSALLDNDVHHLRAFRRSDYRRTAGLAEDMEYAEDRDLIYKLEEVTRFAFIDRPLYRYRRLPGSQSQDRRKREAGARNHLRGQVRALRRRGLRGRVALAHLIRFAEIYLVQSREWPRTKAVVLPRLQRLARWTCARWVPTPAAPHGRWLPPRAASPRPRENQRAK